jgi:UDP-GlcNAc:undecaprenyl-phosphate GlcNAc-1-phosphate transferase
MWYLIYSYIFIVSLLVSVVLTRLMISVSQRLGFYDLPKGRKNHERPIPYLGGVAIYMSFLGVIAVHMWILHLLRDDFTIIARVAAHLRYSAALGEKPAVLRALGIILGGTLIFLVGLVDDIHALRARTKLLAQVLAAVIMVAFGVRLELFVPSQIVTSIATVFWVVLIVNAFNFMDNMDGLCAGVALIASLIFFFVVFPLHQNLTAAILLVVAGILLGFLFYNFNPARIFMGDAGAMFIGFVIAALTVVGTFYMVDHMSPWGLFTPILILSVPIFDTVSVIYLRRKAHLPIYIGDNRHFSHRLVHLGMSKRDAVIFIYLVSLSVGLGATLLRYLGLVGAITLFVQTLGIFAIIVLLMVADRKKRITEQWNISNEPEEQKESGVEGRNTGIKAGRSS